MQGIYETISLAGIHGFSQIGGHPSWIHFPDYLPCPDCGKLMTFIGQLGIPDIGSPGDGILYTFLCSEYGIGAMNGQAS
jgi:hypothetical protein